MESQWWEAISQSSVPGVFVESRYSEAGVDATRSRVERKWCPGSSSLMPMLVLMEEAYPRAAVFSPYGNVHGGIVPVARETDPESAGGGTTPDDRMTGCPAGILPVAKLILRRSSSRDSVSASG
jgi:hypothetical protein